MSQNSKKDPVQSESARQLRKNARRQAQRLRRDPKWQSDNLEDRFSQNLHEYFLKENSHHVQADAESCPDCDHERVFSGDPTRLCPSHLAAAMGFSS